MTALVERLKQPGAIVADGAMGTMLFHRGLKPGDCPEHLNLISPDVLEDIARLYFAAGAEIIQTNTFGGSPLKLAQYGFDDQTEEINAVAVRAVRSVVGDHGHVSASCGPSGRMLEPYGDTDPEVVYDSFRRQMRVMIAEGPDMICIETMTDLAEAALAIAAAKSLSSSIPICATMTFDPTPRGFRTVMGTSIEQAAAGLAEAGADIVGSNCGSGIVNMTRIAEEFSRHTRLPIIIRSNAGIPVVQDGRTVYPETPEFMAEKCIDLIRCGTRIIGGCCGTTPEHIAAMKREVSKHLSHE